MTGEWNLLIDGVLWANRNVLVGRRISSGGVLTIGEITDNGEFYNLVGTISRLNLWSKAMNGGEIEEMAKSPGSREGDLINWLLVKDAITSDLKINRPSNASFSGLLYSSISS
jgi:hypothetical protein